LYFLKLEIYNYFKIKLYFLYRVSQNWLPREKREP
jgi:hypothetical protein